MINFYQLNHLNAISVKLEPLEVKPQGNGRAHFFLSNLSAVLKNGYLDTDVTTDELDGAVSLIQARVEAKDFYAFMSWIPGTDAYRVSELITQVKDQIDQKKQAREKQLTSLSVGAAKNRTDCDDYFVASDNLADLISDSVEYKDPLKDKLKKNQYMLFYSVEIGAFWDQSKPHLYRNLQMAQLVPVIVEFEPTHKLVNLLDMRTKNDENPHIQYCNSLMSGNYVKIDKNDVFKKLIEI